MSMYSSSQMRRISFAGTMVRLLRVTVVAAMAPVLDSGANTAEVETVPASARAAEAIVPALINVHNHMA